LRYLSANDASLAAFGRGCSVAVMRSPNSLASWPPHCVGAWLLEHGWRIEAENDGGSPSMPALHRPLVLIPPGASRHALLGDTAADRLLAALEEPDWLRIPPATIRTGGSDAPSSVLLASARERTATWSGDLRTLVAPPPRPGLAHWCRAAWSTTAVGRVAKRTLTGGGHLELRILGGESAVDEDESLDRSGVTVVHRLAVCLHQGGTERQTVHTVVEPIAWADLHALTPSAEAIASLHLWLDAAAAAAVRSVERDPSGPLQHIELAPLSRWLAEWTTFGPPGAPPPAPLVWSGVEPEIVVTVPWRASRPARTWTTTAAVALENLAVEIQERRQGVRVCVRDGDTVEEFYRNEAMLGHRVSGSEALTRSVLQRLADILGASSGAAATASRFAWPAADDRRIDSDWRILTDAFTTDEPAEVGPVTERLVRALGGTHSESAPVVVLERGHE
jgi:hypothetical protein